MAPCASHTRLAEKFAKTAKQASGKQCHAKMQKKKSPMQAM